MAATTSDVAVKKIKARIERIEAILKENGLLRYDEIGRAAVVNQFLWLIEDEVRREKRA